MAYGDFGFVGLEVANQMPLQPGGAHGYFRLRFLHPVFAKQAQSAVGRLAHGFGRLGF